MSTNTLLQVRIPDGVTSGSSITVQGTDGRHFAVIVPEGVGPGDTLTVDVRDTSGSVATVVVAEPVSGMSLEQRPASAEGQNNASKAALGAAAVGAVVGTLLIGPVTGATRLCLCSPITV